MKIIYVETGEVRPPKKGEPFFDDGGVVDNWAGVFEFSNTPRRIMSRLEVPDDVAERLIDNAIAGNE